MNLQTQKIQLLWTICSHDLLYYWLSIINLISSLSTTQRLRSKTESSKSLSMTHFFFWEIALLQKLFRALLSQESYHSMGSKNLGVVCQESGTKSNILYWNSQRTFYSFIAHYPNFKFCVKTELSRNELYQTKQHLNLKDLAMWFLNLPSLLWII